MIKFWLVYISVTTYQKSFILETVTLGDGIRIMQGAHWSEKSQGNFIFLQGQGKAGDSVKWTGKLENL